VKDPNLVEKDNSYATAFALADVGSEFGEERFDLAPTDVRARRVSEDCFKDLLVLPLPQSHGTIKQYCETMGTGKWGGWGQAPFSRNRPTLRPQRNQENGVCPQLVLLPFAGSLLVLSAPPAGMLRYGTPAKKPEWHQGAK